MSALDSVTLRFTLTEDAGRAEGKDARLDTLNPKKPAGLGYDLCSCRDN